MNDDDLRSRFDGLRRGDQRVAPPFDAVLARPRAARTGTFAAVLAAAAVIIVAIGLQFLTPPTPVVSEPANAPSIVSWESPTASLLQTPGHELLHTVPTIRSSLLSGAPLE